MIRSVNNFILNEIEMKMDMWKTVSVTKLHICKKKDKERQFREFIYVKMEGLEDVKKFKDHPHSQNQNTNDKVLPYIHPSSLKQYLVDLHISIT